MCKKAIEFRTKIKYLWHGVLKMPPPQLNIGLKIFFIPCVSYTGPISRYAKHRFKKYIYIYIICVCVYTYIYINIYIYILKKLLAVSYTKHVSYTGQNGRYTKRPVNETSFWLFFRPDMYHIPAKMPGIRNIVVQNGWYKKAFWSFVYRAADIQDSSVYYVYTNYDPVHRTFVIRNEVLAVSYTGQLLHWKLVYHKFCQVFGACPKDRLFFLPDNFLFLFCQIIFTESPPIFNESPTIFTESLTIFTKSLTNFTISPTF